MKNNGGLVHGWGKKQLLWSETWSTGGGRLTYLQSLQTLAGQSGVAFTPWVAVPGEYTLDLLRHSTSATRHGEAVCRT
ncbi:hypothetical protein TNCV_3785291 [Trichonephila clavipes]|nr:hypothetical protein TNCV_3785291 [Trichonephila clavipes]